MTGRDRAALAFAVAALGTLLAMAPAASAYPEPYDAQPFFDSPCLERNDRHFVYDLVGILDHGEGTYVEARGCDLYREDGVHLVVAIVPDLDGESLEDYAVGLVRAWGIGDEDRLDGLLVLYTMDDGFGSGAMRVEVGYGLEGVVNSIVAREAVDSAAAIKQADLGGNDLG